MVEVVRRIVVISALLDVEVAVILVQMYVHRVVVHVLNVAEVVVLLLEMHKINRVLIVETCVLYARPVVVMCVKQAVVRHVM